MKKTYSLILAIAISIVTITAHANGTDETGDFGQKLITFIAGGGGSYHDQSLLSTASKYLALIALSMMAYLAALGATNFIIQTANKGVPGGQVISSFWMPIRICLSVILLIPLSSGYSSIQYGVITVAEKGNEAGNTVMAPTLKYLYENGAYRAPALQDGSPIMLAWVMAEVCRLYINDVTDYETINSNYRSGVDAPLISDTLKRYAEYSSGIYYDHSEPGSSARKANPRLNYCGAIEFKANRNGKLYENSEGEFDLFDNVLLTNRDEYTSEYSGPEALIKKQTEILQKLHPKVIEIANMILSDQEALNALISQGEEAQSAFESARDKANESAPQIIKKMQELTSSYNSLTQNAIAGTVNDLVTAKNDGANWVDQTVKAGWVSLGTIFWQSTMSQMQINDLARAFNATYTANKIDGDFAGDERLAEINARLSSILSTKRYSGDNPGNIEFDMYSLSAIADAGSEGKGIVDGIKAGAYDLVSYAFSSMAFKNGHDPIVNMQYFGNAIGSAAENTYWLKTILQTVLIGFATAASTAADGAKASVDNSLLGLFGLGAPISGATGALAGIIASLQFAFEQTSGFFNTLLLYLIILGLILGVVLPTIPLIQWFMGAISWALFFVECLLISPMWLAAHGTADKEGWGTEHTRQGYMLMIGLFMSPTLRVVGFLAILLMLRPIGVLMSMVIDYIQGVVVSGFINPFLLLGAMGLVTIFAYSSMVRIFGLPSELFERGLRWVNGGQEVTGDSHAERETRNTIAAFSTKSEGAASRSGLTTPYSLSNTATRNGGQLANQDIKPR